MHFIIKRCEDKAHNTQIVNVLLNEEQFQGKSVANRLNHFATIAVACIPRIKTVLLWLRRYKQRCTLKMLICYYQSVM